jgi:hypothetical protein
LVGLPTNYRLPEFTKFTGQDSTSMIEHVCRYLTQLGEASVEEAHKVHFFSLSLSGPAFIWFSSLTTNSIAKLGGPRKEVSYIFLYWDRGKKDYRFDKYEADN